MFGLFKRKPAAAPSQFEVEQALSFSEFTPDIAILERRKTNLLFVYDEMQEDHRDFSLVEEHSVHLGTAFTKDNFVMYKRKLGQESSAFVLDDSPLPGPVTMVKGQLFAVKMPCIPSLDAHKRNMERFERRRVSLIVPHYKYGWTERGMFKEYRVASVRAYMYVGIADYWHPLLDEEFFLYDRVRTFTPNNKDLKEYYHFSKLEYD